MPWLPAMATMTSQSVCVGLGRRLVLGMSVGPRQGAWLLCRAPTECACIICCVGLLPWQGLALEWWR